MQLVQLSPVTDFEEIKAYTTKLFSELFGENAIPTKATFQRIKACLTEQTSRHWAYAVREDGETLGYFTLAEACSVFAHGQYGILNELWVAPQCRSQGIGAFIIQQVREIAEQKFWLRVDVTAPPADKWLRSVEFYENQGFIHTGKKLKLLID